MGNGLELSVGLDSSREHSKKFRRYLIALLAFFSCLSLANIGLTEVTDPKDTSQSTEVKEPDLGSKDQWIPFVYFTPETSLATGVFYLRNLGKTVNGRTSQFRSVGVLTVNKQVFTNASLSYYGDGGDFLFAPKISFSIYPKNFYGIGNQNQVSAEEGYDEVFHSIGVSTRRRWFSEFFGGLEFYYDNRKLLEIEQGSGLGSQYERFGPWTSEFRFGPIFVWDTRDFDRKTTRGQFHSLKVLHAQSLGGDDYGYDAFDLDLRFYWKMTSNGVVALQARVAHLEGDAIPFQKLNQLGGRNTLRGLYAGRYRDRSKFAVQAEYRGDFSEKWTYAVFLGAGRVARNLPDLQEGRLHPTCGAGLRYLVNKQSRTQIRVDYGIAEDQSGFYFIFDDPF